LVNMKVERILYGMQTSDGKIALLKTPGVNNILTFKSQEIIRNLKPADSHRYLWFKTEQTIAYPIITEVADQDPKHGGRTWVQNQTYLVNIHEFISHILSNGGNIFEKLVQPEYTRFPDVFDALQV
jgi:hypothetical protein